MNTFDVIIIGAGAAGLMCAIESSKRSRSVIILEHANKIGKKILMSGGGRCNFTNLNVTSENFISHNPHFCKSALSRYTPANFINMVKNHNIAFHEKKLGQLFCDNKSKDILNMLLSECKNNNVNIKLNCTIKSITETNKNLPYKFLVLTKTDSYQCKSLVIATGGLSIPTMGATPFGYQIAKQFGLNIHPTRAGLVPFTLHIKDKELFANLSGTSIPCTIKNKETVFTENLLFTHRGLSGPAILQISSYWTPGEEIIIDFLPSAESKLFKDNQAKIKLKKYLTGYLPKRFISTIFEQTLLEATLNKLTENQIKKITKSLHHWDIVPNGTEGYRTAEVTLGGVDCNQISSKTMEVNSITGLYFIGEVLDVTGWLGGYNFQWAWSSGWAAGQTV